MFQICLQDNSIGAQKVHIKPVAADQVPDSNQQQYGLFKTVRQASDYLRHLADKHRLCHHVLGLETGVLKQKKSCFRFQLNRCAGACCGQETLQEHQRRLKQALTSVQVKDWPWPSAVLVVEQDKNNSDMTWLHLIDGWVYVAALTSLAEVADFGYRLAQHRSFDTQGSVAKGPIQAGGFNLDVYYVLNRFLGSFHSSVGGSQLEIVPLTSIT